MAFEQNFEALERYRTKIPNGPQLDGCGSEISCAARYTLAAGCVIAAVLGKDPAGFLAVAMLAIISLQISRRWPRPWPAPPAPAGRPPESSP